MEEALIQYKNVEIHQQELCVLSDVNLELHKGEFVYLIGKVGSGKTSLLKTFYGELDVIDGEAEVLGYNMRSIKRKHIPQLRRKLGIVFQDFQLLTDRTVYNNLEFVLRATGWKNKKEIQDRIKSINDTLKITNAMYMISSSKLKKAKKMLADTEPYFFTLQSEMSRILRHLPDMEDIYFKSNEDKPMEERKVGYIVITADKGLAGSYNHNVLKLAEEHLLSHPNHELFVLGELGRHYFEQRGIEIEKQFHYTVQNPTLNRARNIAEEIIEMYQEEKLDEVYIIYTTMVNAVQEETQILQLLPLKKTDFNMKLPIDIPHEELALRPSAEAVMDRIVPDYVVGFVYGALVESYSCEQNARMMAMEAASKSAKDMLHELDILYNRARQAAITQEITEVIAGAKSQKRKRKK